MLRKNINIVFGLITITVCQFLFSCNTSVEIAKRHYHSGYYVNIHKKHNDSKQPSIAKIIKEYKQPEKPVASKNDNDTYSNIENHNEANDNQIASADNSMPVIVNNKIDFSVSDNNTADNFVSSSIQKAKTKEHLSGSNGEASYYSTRWLLYLGLAVVAVTVGIILLSSSALGFSYLLIIIGGVLLLLAVIYFIKWVNFL